jgi:hypothetical protein
VSEVGTVRVELVLVLALVQEQALLALADS